MKKKPMGTQPPPAPKKKREKPTSAVVREKMNTRQKGLLSNKPQGKFQSPSMQTIHYQARSVQDALYPGKKYTGLTIVKPGRADAKPSPKKVAKGKK